MRPFVVGTAGHIDHGKSALVKALTGIDPDRLPEERARGITIELGFAHGELVPGVVASWVDVPGHERFVREMAAGAHGVDLVVLIVALDEGVMPQTREHAEICRLLGAVRVVVALTKSDLAPSLDPAWPALVEEDVRSLGSPFAEAPVVRVSARTGEGLETLRRTLADLAKSLPARPTSLPPLLPIDRAFTVAGHGTVVTGTLVMGRLAVGDTIEMAIGQASVIEALRVRSLQTHGQRVNQATAGQRVAVNVPGIEVAQVPRGAALMGPGASKAWCSSAFDVELELARGAMPLKNRAKVRLHLGTAQAIATVDLLGRESLPPGEKRVAQLRLDRAVAGVRGQRFVLRGDAAASAAGRTVAGGRVLLPSQRRRRVRDEARVAALAGDEASAWQALVEEAGALGVDAREGEWRVGEPARGAAIVREGGRLFAASVLDGLVERLRGEIRRAPGRSREDVRSTLGPAVAPEAFAHAVARLGPEFAVGETLELASRVRSALEERVLAALASGGRTPPTASELASLLKVAAYDVGGALRGLAKRGEVVKLTDDLFATCEVARSFRDEVVAAIAARGPLTTLEIKEIAGVSRKYLIPFCEWLDREHVTLRVGERRSLRRAP